MLFRSHDSRCISDTNDCITEDVWVFQSLSEDAGDAVGGGNFGLLVIMTNKREKSF